MPDKSIIWLGSSRRDLRMFPALARRLAGFQLRRLQHVEAAAWQRILSTEESEHLLVRADLLIQVQKAIASKGLKPAEAAKVLRVTQPRISDLLRGRIDLFSTDALIDMLARLGVGVPLVVKPARARKVA